MLMSLNQTAPLLALNKEGITSKTTPVSKAAGLIPWKDIIGIDLQKVGWDMLIMLTVERADYHMPIIKKKLSSMAVSDAKDANGNLQIFMTASELDIEADELLTIIKDYRKTLS